MRRWPRPLRQKQLSSQRLFFPVVRHEPLGQSLLLQLFQQLGFLTGFDHALALYHDLLLALPLLILDVANLESRVYAVVLQALDFISLDERLAEHFLFALCARELDTPLGFAKCGQPIAELAQLHLLDTGLFGAPAAHAVEWKVKALHFPRRSRPASPARSAPTWCGQTDCARPSLASGNRAGAVASGSRRPA